MKLLLLSNSTAPGQPFLAHALDEIAELAGDATTVAFIAYGASDAATYTTRMQEALAPIGLRVLPTTTSAELAAALASAQSFFVGGGNAFRLLKGLAARELLEHLRACVKDGAPYFGASAGANIACPTIRTTNDMPIVEPADLAALCFVPFQINAHYPTEQAVGAGGETRDERLAEFLEENDVPVLALPEGAWLKVDGSSAHVGGVEGARLFQAGKAASVIGVGTDVSWLLETRPRYDVGASPAGLRPRT